MENYNIWIAEDFVAAIVNDDYSGLNDDEEELVKDYLDSLQGYIALSDNAQTEWKRCDICGMDADCVEVAVICN